MSVVTLCEPDAAADTATSESALGKSATSRGADCVVVSLVPAVFGPQRDTERAEAEYERQGRIRFVRILLEG